MLIVNESENGKYNMTPANQTFKSGSHEGRYFYQQGRSSLFSFVYTYRYFTIFHCLTDKSGQKCEEN